MVYKPELHILNIARAMKGNGEADPTAAPHDSKFLKRGLVRPKFQVLESSSERNKRESTSDESDAPPPKRVKDKEEENDDNAPNPLSSLLAGYGSADD